MNEVLRNFRQIVVEHMRDVLYVYAARRYIRRHQNLVPPLLKTCQRRIALRLRTPAVNHRR